MKHHNIPEKYIWLNFIGYSTDDFVRGVYEETCLMMSKGSVFPLASEPSSMVSVAEQMCQDVNGTFLTDPNDGQIIALMELGSRCLATLVLAF